jgi:nicotinamide mononucleotide transporter
LKTSFYSPVNIFTPNPISLQDIYQQFITGLQQTTPLEFIAVIAGIISVWYAQKENILVFPVGLINTTIFIYLSLKVHLFGEASVNLYYTIMSIYGWILWSKKDKQHHQVVTIQYSSNSGLLKQAGFFLFFYISIYSALTYLKKDFAPEAIPWADAFAASTAYTAMWLMAKKKVESWYWWIATNITSIPLYFVKGYVFTSFQFIIFLIMAIIGLARWHKKAKSAYA